MGYEKKWYTSLVFIFTAIFGRTNSSPDFTQYVCSNSVGNYTQNSTYQSNLNKLLSSLSSNISPYGFYNSTAGEDPDRVYAIMLCRGDASIQNCQNCIHDSVTKLVLLCPNQKEAIGWYTSCMLRFSNTNIFDNMTTNPNFNLQGSGVPANLAHFNQELSSLSYNLRNQTYSGSSLLKFAAGQSRNESGVNAIYAYMQCTPDLDSGDCDLCLGWAMMMMMQCCSGVNGARVIAPSCSYWYEPFSFIDENVILSRPPLP